MALSNTTDPERAAKSLADWWAKTHPGDDGVAVTDVCIPHSAGMSSETILFDLTRTDADGQVHVDKLAARVIVPGGEVFPDYDLRCEALVMESVRGSTRAPVPAVLSVEYDTAVLGGPFLLMEQRHGRTLGDDPPFTVGGWFTELQPEQRAAMFENGLAALVEVHRTDTSRLPSELLGHPNRAAGGATAQHVEYWREFFVFCRNGKAHRVVETALGWLTDNLPEHESALGLVWGDARPGNMLFDDDCRVTAVLDWELLGLGPAELDLGWFAFLNRMYTEGIGIPIPDGMPSQDALLARYGELAGRPLRHTDYYEILAGTRLSIVMMRLAHMLVDKGLMPADHPMPTTNPASIVLAGLLGIDPPGSEAGWVTGHR